MTALPVMELPDVSALTLGQQMAICCAQCGRRLGASGRVWGQATLTVHGRTFTYTLWICTAPCTKAAA